MKQEYWKNKFPNHSEINNVIFWLKNTNGINSEKLIELGAKKDNMGKWYFETKEHCPSKFMQFLTGEDIYDWIYEYSQQKKIIMCNIDFEKLPKIDNLHNKGLLFIKAMEAVPSNSRTIILVCDIENKQPFSCTAHYENGDWWLSGKICKIEIDETFVWMECPV